MVTAVRIDARQRAAVTGGMDGSINVWDLNGGVVSQRLFLPHGITHLVLTTEAGIVLSNAGNLWNPLTLITRWSIWDLSSGQAKGAISDLGSTFGPMTISKDGRFLVWGSSNEADLPMDFYLQRLDLRTGETRSLPGGPNFGRSLWSICAGPRPETIVCGYDGGIDVYDCDRSYPDTLVATFGYPGTVETLACAQDGRSILASSSGRNVTLWDLVSGKQELLLTSSTPRALAISVDGRYGMALCESGWATSWDLKEARILQSVPVFSEALAGAIVAIHGTWAVIYALNEAKVWNCIDGSIACTFQSSCGTACDITQDGTVVAIGEGSGAVHLLQVLFGDESSKRLEHERIAQLAYTYWQSRSGEGGSAEEDWARAEREIASHLKGPRKDSHTK